MDLFLGLNDVFVLAFGRSENSILVTNEKKDFFSGSNLLLPTFQTGSKLEI